MTEHKVLVATAAEMSSLGARLAGLLRAGDVVLLIGDLGAGKTTLTRGLGAALAVQGEVSSPTFVIARRHRPLGSGPGLLHVDAYRLTASEVADLEIDVDLEDHVAVVEWGVGKVEDWARSRLEIRIEPTSLELAAPRLVTIEGVGPRWANADWTTVQP